MYFTTAGKDGRILVRHRRTLSAYTAIFSFRAPLIKPIMSEEVHKRQARGSMVMAKSRGDNGQTCLVPQKSLKGGDRRPSTLGAVYNRQIYWQMVKPKLHFLRTLHKYGHLTIEGPNGTQFIHTKFLLNQISHLGVQDHTGHKRKFTASCRLTFCLTVITEP